MFPPPFGDVQIFCDHGLAVSFINDNPGCHGPSSLRMDQVIVRFVYSEDRPVNIPKQQQAVPTSVCSLRGRLKIVAEHPRMLSSDVGFNGSPKAHGLDGVLCCSKWDRLTNKINRLPLYLGGSGKRRLQW